MGMNASDRNEAVQDIGGLPNHLRKDEQHEIHHHLGDIGGEYEGRPPESEGDLPEAELQLDDVNKPVFIIVMGVSACGKSTIGAGLASKLGLPFIDADDLHPQANIEKMSRGEPLDDEDRLPWLAKIRTVASQTCEQQSQAAHSGRPEGSGRGVFMGCSALKRSYRDVLRGHAQHLQDHPTYDAESDVPHPLDLSTYFVHISGSKEALLERISNRKGHFMKKEMLESQLATLEVPDEVEEPDAINVPLERSVNEQIADALSKLERVGLKIVKKQRSNPGSISGQTST